MKSNIDELTTQKVYRTDRSQLRQFPKFENSQLSFNLIVNVDGVAPDNCRSTMWVVYFALVELDHNKRGKRHNMAATSVIAGCFKPSQDVWKLVVEPLKKELQELKEHGISINGKTFFLSSVNGSIDLDVSYFFYSLLL